MFTTKLTCPLCHNGELTSVFEKREMPIYNLERHYSRESALHARVGAIHFKFCAHCEFAFNAAFDNTVMDYSIDYESSRSSSGVFHAYLDELTNKILATVSLTNSVVVEVGCGDGHFLKLLRSKTRFDGYGFDPCLEFNLSHRPDDGLVFRSEYFSEDSLNDRAPDLVILRHILEHQPDPEAFLKCVAAGARDIYIEIPCWEWIVTHDQFYAFSYEHCSYFTKKSLISLLESLGYAPRWVEYGFNGEYLQYCGSLKPDTESRLTTDSPEYNTDAFISRIQIAMDKVRSRLEASAGESVLWGAAGKGITLLNLLDMDDSKVSVVVDSNPLKTGTYVPRTAQRVIPPPELNRLGPKYVFLTNPLYQAEVALQLKALHLAPSIIVV